MTARLLAALLLTAPGLSAQIVGDPGSVHPDSAWVDLSDEPTGFNGYPWKIDGVKFYSVGGLTLADLTGLPTLGFPVAGKALIPYRYAGFPSLGYGKIEVRFPKPVREVGLSWHEAPGGACTVRAFDAAGNVLAAAPGAPTAGTQAFLAVQWTGDVIARVEIAPQDPADAWALAGVSSFRGSPAPVTYCPGKPSSTGCDARITTPGAQPVSGAADYTVLVTDVDARRNGALFYSQTGPAALPYAGGTLCLAGPVRVVPVVFSGNGAPGCTGSLAFTANAGAPDPGPGRSAWVQALVRDPFDPWRVSMSDAVRLDYR